MKIKLFKAQTSEHFQTVAQLHKEGISEGFLSSLGNPFLHALYKGISHVEGSGVLMAQNGEKILGYIAYTCNVNHCYKEVLIKNWPSLTFAMIPNIFKPNIYKKVFETLSYPARKISDNTSDIPGEPVDMRPELLSMAVISDARGLGVGKLLVQALDEVMIQMKLPGYYVVTHSIDTRSNGFYLGRDFQKIREFHNHGKPMNEYYKKLPSTNLPLA